MASQTTTKALDLEVERVSKVGMELASPLPGEEVVITGMAGRFPDSDDIYHYRYNLLNKVDMVSSDNRRWDLNHPEIPKRTGKINFIEKFDAGFFGIHHQQAESMDPQCRQIMERAFEAIMVAGVNPEQLRGSNTGVFVGTCASESEKTWFYDKLESSTFGFTGCARSMQAQRISYFMGLEGPSYTMDTACGSSMYALEHAYRAIKMGRCDSALVSGTNLCLHPIMTLQHARLGVLSMDGSCKSFDADADGYVRSEAVCVIFLQKMKDAKRVYAQIVHAKTNCDGYKEQGITFPSSLMQKQLLKEVYQECNIDPGTVDFFEAHATGTKVGDPEEISAIDEVFCVNRRTPLLVGSCKSNLGHAEPASGVCSIVKVLLGMENDCIMPNLHYRKAREGAEALEEGRLVIVTETTPWPKNGSGYAAVNSFGFGGANCHVLLKRIAKKKINGGQPRDELPRLVCVSGRTQHAIEFILDDVSGRPLDADFVRILHDAFGCDIAAHPHRGFIVMSKTGELERSHSWFAGVRQPICLTFGGANEKWLSIGNQLVTVPLIAATIQRAHNIMSPMGVNISDIISKGSSNNVGSTIIGSIVIQAGLVDILKALGLSPDFLIGYSTGELVAAYADGALTLEQALVIAYHVGQVLESLSKGVTSYQVESDKKKIQSIISNDGEIIAHNSADCYTISGPSQIMVELVDNLRNQEIYTKEVHGTFTLHSKYLKQKRSKLLQKLKEVVPHPKRRSLKWLSTSISEAESPAELSKYASAEYFVHTFLSPILFNEAISKLPSKASLLEIGTEISSPGKLNVIKWMNGKDGKNDIQSLLWSLGRMYELGYNLKLDKLYPKVQWPVSLNTPMVSPLIKWNHTEDWFVASFNGHERMRVRERVISFKIKEPEWAFMAGHIIDGRNLVPTSAYLVTVWETHAMMLNKLMSETKVIFENVNFHRATNIPKDSTIELVVMIQHTTGQFEVTELSELVVTGRIFISDDLSQEMLRLPLPKEESPVRFTTKEIYKELRIRGYNYMGMFRGLNECDLSASTGKIKWHDNWIAFIENMLQMKLLQEDTRNLYVPTCIERLAIDYQAHIKYIKDLGENPTLPVYAYKKTEIIKSGHIVIRGLTASSIPRRKPIGEPLLESYKFIPFEAKLSVEQSVRVHAQLFYENSLGIKFRTVELIQNEGRALAPLIHRAFSDIPLIQSEVVVLSEKPLQLSNVTVVDKKLAAESHSCSVVVASKVLSRPEIKEQSLEALKDSGAILSREGSDFELAVAERDFPDVKIISVHQVGTEKIVLMRKLVEYTKAKVIDVSNNFNYDWLPTLQAAAKNDEEVIVLAQNAPLSGVLGLVKCLRREPGGTNIKCVFVADNHAPKFDTNDEFYSKQLTKGLAFNVFKDGKWGTYRHLLLDKAALVQREHVFCDVAVRGDLSSMRWIEGPLTSNSILPPEKVLVHIYYASMNFRDVMTASGRLSNDVVTRCRIEQSNVHGCEFAGRDSSGRRVMGMVNNGALSSMVAADLYLIWKVPDNYSMEEAATIPVAYATAIYGIVVIGQIKPDQSILIHAGSGGVGQAAINVALHHKCNIFTTVGTDQKREFIKKTFPQIPESQIGNSRDTSFEQMVMKKTKGRGVDMVLNSLSGDKLQASVRCLAPSGRFLEIGKFDLASNSSLGLGSFTEGRSFHGIMLDGFFGGAPRIKEFISGLITEGLKSGMVKPLTRTIFKDDELEQAFRFMAAGKHIGKVMIKVRDEEPENEINTEFRLFGGISRFYCNADHCYVIAGGLGGFGLELADWLVLRGAKKLVLLSRVGVATGYQASRIRIWKSYGTTTIISTVDITTRAGCEAVLKGATELGPVEGIFNLAVVLKDALLENQNEESFKTALAPKAIATQHLDTVSRELCPNLKFFVVFSSMVSAHGNAGQINYGMSNSIMEKVCEERKQQGYPALAIQWSAIGEIGLIAEMQEFQTDTEVCGTLQQRIASCLEMMDTFLRQDETVVASMVVPEKKSGEEGSGAVNLVDVIKNIMGLRDLKAVSLHSTLSELGMDSIMAVEIKQTLEREYEVFLTAQDIRGMTFAKLQEIAQEKASENENDNKREGKKDQLSQGLHFLLGNMGNEEISDIPMLRLTSLIKEKAVASKIFLLPGMDGFGSVLEPMAANLASHAICLQFTARDKPLSTVEDIAKSVLPHVEENLPQNISFTLVGYSFGAAVAMELASLLETEGRRGTVILIDGSPAMSSEMVRSGVPKEEAHLQTLIVCTIMQFYLPQDVVMTHKGSIYDCKTFEDRVNMVLKLAPEGTPHSERYQRRVCYTSYARIKAMLIYNPAFRKLKSMVKLFISTQSTAEGYHKDAQLQEICENQVEVRTFNGNHLTILKNPEVASAINNIVESGSVCTSSSR